MPDDFEAAPVITHDVRSYFHDAVRSAVLNQQLDISDFGASYLVNLLCAFVDTDRLFHKDTDGIYLRPLAEIYSDAVNATTAGERGRALRRLGDVALFVSGVFADFLSRRIVDIDYYVSMGGSAYACLADCGHEGAGHDHGAVFSELAENFVSCVDVLAEACETKAIRNEHDLLRLYEVWLRTGSERSARQLSASGILVAPNAVSRSHH